MKVVLIASTSLNNVIPGYQWSPDHGVNKWSEWGPSHADELAEMAGRLCYLAWLRKRLSTASNAGYLANIIAQGHFSVLEHASATFYIEGVTRAFLAELERHRHLSFSVLSQRYVDHSDAYLVSHPELVKLSDATKDRLQEHMVAARQLYSEVVDELAGTGDSRKTARGAARLVLPEGTETKILVTGNLRAWRDVLEKRLSPAVDAEFRAVAKEILRELQDYAPNSFQDFTEEGRHEFRQRWVTTESTNIPPDYVIAGSTEDAA